MEDVTKRCPYCGEEILAIAIKCRYCHEWLDNNNVIKEHDSKENTLATNDKRAIEASPEETLINEEEAITDEGTNLSEENNDEDKSGLEEDKSLIYNDEDKINQINKIIEVKTLEERIREERENKKVEQEEDEDEVKVVDDEEQERSALF